MGLISGLLALPGTVFSVAWSLFFGAPRSAEEAALSPEDAAKIRVAVIGGGIAGTGSAFALRRAGFQVEVFEACERLGGNAKTHTWDTAGGPVVTGLSVLAWPKCYFHNYRRLLAELGVASESVELPFWIQSRTGGSDTVRDLAHGRDTPFRQQCAGDLCRWARMVWVVRFVGDLLTGTSSEAPSFFAMSFLNPFNLISLRTLARLFGVSREFWLHVVVPMYSSSFLTVNLDGVPAVIAPTLHDLIPVDGVPRMDTWAGNSREVFDRLARDCELTVHPSFTVDSVRFTGDGKIAVGGLVTPDPARGASSCDGPGGEGARENEGAAAAAAAATTHGGFDRVIFACAANYALAALEKGGGASALERALLSRVQYTDDEDAAWKVGLIHSDETVLPEAHRDLLLSRFANYIEVEHRKAGLPAYENTFLISSWYPAVGRLFPRTDADGDAAKRPAMMVTYNSNKVIRKVVGKVYNIHNHPHLSTTNLTISQAMRLLQGGHGGRAFFCGSYATPGNGHELSLLSGFAVAHRIGARYPFVGRKNEDAAGYANAVRDFDRLRSLMGL